MGIHDLIYPCYHCCQRILWGALFAAPMLLSLLVEIWMSSHLLLSLLVGTWLSDLLLLSLLVGTGLLDLLLLSLLVGTWLLDLLLLSLLVVLLLLVERLLVARDQGTNQVSHRCAQALIPL